MKMRRKVDLPQKICAACGRPFAWRRKWVRDWENVRYCSQRCRRNGAGRGPDDQAGKGAADGEAPDRCKRGR